MSQVWLGDARGCSRCGSDEDGERAARGEGAGRVGGYIGEGEMADAGAEGAVVD